MRQKNFAYRDLPRKEVRQLPLLAKVQAAYPFARLDDAYVICAQHLLETSAILFNNLFYLGLSPHRFSVIGKCYSTDPTVHFELKCVKGLDVCPSSQKFSPTRSFDNQYEENVRSFFELRLNRILTSGCKKLIVIDDGGTLIETINDYVKLKILPAVIKIIGIEQTSAGFAKLQTVDLSFPVINVARSEVKLGLEATLIADAILASLQLALEEINLTPKRALVLGKGALGSKVEEKLNLYYNVDSYDPLTDRGSIHNFKEIEFNRYDLIVGCSGKEAIDPANFHLLKKKTVLASGSSSDREFCGAMLRAQLGRSPHCHEHLNINGVHLLNCGFPVNFSGYYKLVDDERYQLTRSLLLAGILQACTQETLPSHFIELAPSIQQMIRQEFFTLYPSFLEEKTIPAQRSIFGKCSGNLDFLPKTLKASTVAKREIVPSLVEIPL